MYIILDMENLVFRRKLSNLARLLDLHYIECSGVECKVFPCDMLTMFEKLTAWELFNLYKNTTGVTPTTMLHSTLAKMCMDAALSIEPDQLNGMEIIAQANAVPFTDAGLYKFVPGAVKPARVGTLFDGNIKRAVAGAKPVQQVPAQVPANPVQNAPRTGSGRVVTNFALPTVPVTVQPERGQSIRDIANQAWEQAGKPTGLMAVLGLRKSLTERLTAMGYSSENVITELTEWHKGLSL